jgi:hypothetical protein
MFDILRRLLALVSELAERLRGVIDGPKFDGMNLKRHRLSSAAKEP